LTPDELRREAIDLCPDLLALALPRSFTLAGGVVVHTAGSGDDGRAAEAGSLLGPVGWLAAFTAGDLLAVRYDGEQVQLEPLPDAALDEPANRAVAEELGRAFAALQGERAPEVHRLVVDTIGRAPASFATPVAPVADLLAAAGLAGREVWVGPADQAWPTPPEQARRRRLEELLSGAEWCCQRAARAAFDAWQAWLATPGDGAPLAAEEAERLAHHVEHGPVAAALADVATLGRPLVTVGRLGGWAERIAAGTEQAQPGAGVQYLRAVGADAAGDAAAAEAHLQAGLRHTADHPACLGLLSELAGDRGDADRALTLLRQAGRRPDPEAMAELQPFLLGRPPGRNNPCPCGSGRKYKHCCANRPIRQPLLERSRWLLSKAARHAARTDPLAVRSLRQLFDSAIGGGDPTALVADMLLFVHHGLDRYLDTRGALLPSDELATGRSWLDRPLRLLSIGAGQPGGEREAIDERSGEGLFLAGAVALPTDAGAVLARPLPVAEQWLLGPAIVPVPDSSRARAQELLAGEVGPLQLLQLLVDLQVDALTA
jgi:hypothetical protein